MAEPNTTELQYIPAKLFPRTKSMPSLDQLFNNKIPDYIITLTAELSDWALFSDTNASHLARGLLLHGPQGTGKNAIVQNIVDYSGRVCLYLSSGDMSNAWKGSTVLSIKEMFAKATKIYTLTGQDVIIFIDEIDGIAQSSAVARQPEDHVQVISLLKTIMNEQVDNPHVFVIATTNNRDQLDNGIVNRFNELAIELPGREARESILTYCLQEHGIAVIDNPHIADDTKHITMPVFKLLSAITEGFTGRDFAKVITNAQKKYQCRCPYVVTRDNIEGVMGTIASVLKKCPGGCTLLTALISIRTGEIATLANCAVDVVNLDISPSTFINAFRSLNYFLEDLNPIERYVYDAVIKEVQDLAKKPNSAYKKNIKKYIRFASNAKDIITSGLNIVSSI
jgi:hypothetical protein